MGGKPRTSRSGQWARQPTLQRICADSDWGKGSVAVQQEEGRPPAPGGIGEGDGGPEVPSRKARSWGAAPRYPQLAFFSLRASFLFFSFFDQSSNASFLH